MTSCVEAGPAWRLLLRGFNPRQSTESSYSLEDSLLALMQSHGSSCVGAGLNFSYFAEMRSGFEEGSYFRFIDSVSLDSRPRVMKKKKLRRGKTCMAPAFARRCRIYVYICIHMYMYIPYVAKRWSHWHVSLGNSLWIRI